MSNQLGARLDSRDNALNFLRLVLASAVIVGHAYPLGGHGSSRFEGLSGLAVDGFFALSGYLIAGSRMRLPMIDFLVRRCLRILPGFWVCLVATAFLFAPLSGLLAGEYVLGDAIRYVTHNAALTMNQWGIENTLTDVPYREVWNGSLWTLEFEFAAYVAAGLLLSMTLVRRHVSAVLVTLTLLALLLQPLAHGPLHVTTNKYLFALRLGGFFLMGMTLWAVRSKLPVRTAPMLIAGLATGLVFMTVEGPMFDVLLALPLSYLLLALGATLPVRIGAVNDISYGVYIYAFPVAQILAQIGAGDLGVVPFALLTFSVTVPCAWASWALVERPGLRLARRLRRSRRPDPVSTPTV